MEFAAGTGSLMKALVITLPRETWPAGVPHHWHIVDSHISRHVVTAVISNYPAGTVEEYEWTWDSERPTCKGCGHEIGHD